MIITKSVQVGTNEICFEVGKMAKQAGGAVMVTSGETMVLVTATAQDEGREGIDFFPLTVDYLEKTYAAGKFPGGFYKRESKPTDLETLTSRIIDRSIRPLFEKAFQCETQVIAEVMSHDTQNESDILALNGASLALMISDIPFIGPIAGIRVGKIGPDFIVNPTISQLEESELNLVMTVNRDSIVMVEGGAHQLPEEIVIDALMFGFEQAQPIIDLQLEITKECGKEKRQVVVEEKDQELVGAVKAVTDDKLTDLLAISDKQKRSKAIKAFKKATVEKLVGSFPEAEKDIKGVIEDEMKSKVRQIIFNGTRIDGRQHDEVRSISCETGLLIRAHGSGLFTRGETQAMVVATLGTTQDEQRVENIRGESSKRFMLHYNFPPFSTGEVKFMRSPGRREIGHGALAERALLPVMPGADKFPYTVRLVSEILASNGSSSMASVCGGCLALMNAGVPIESPVAGIAMGLVEGEDQTVILSDILGDEDHMGDMDFKVTGTSKGITALQMDIKIEGISKEILTKALAQAKQGRDFILGKMLETQAEYNQELSRYAPRIETVKVKKEKIKDVIGPGGSHIKDIVAKSGCGVNIDDDGTVHISSPNLENIEKAKKMIKELTQEVEVGKTYLGRVTSIKDFGAFVEILPRLDGLVHISELTDKKVARVTDVVQLGDEIMVKVINVDRSGKVKLSRREAIADGRKRR